MTALRRPFSRDTLNIWQNWIGNPKKENKFLLLKSVFFVIVLHVAFGYLLWIAKKNNRQNVSNNANKIQVRFETPKTDIEKIAKNLTPKPLAENIGRQKKKQHLPKVTARDFGAVAESSSAVSVQVPAGVIPENTPQNPQASEPLPAENEATATFGPSSVSKGLQRLLPSANLGTVLAHRDIGGTIGDAPVGGDVEDSQNPVNPGGTIAEQEFSYAAYFDSMSRRFHEAWGGTRSLPTDATFYGKIGEFIEYDVVINRDGTLRKIINVSAMNQPHRDFSAVDALVIDVFKNVFPTNPLPARVKRETIKLRKRIYYAGYRYNIY